MTTAVDTRRICDLCALLGQLSQLHEELARTVDHKIAAMRQADITSLQAHAQSERSIVERIAEREGLRRQLMDALGKSWGLASQAARSLTATELIARAPVRKRAAIEEAIASLRNAVSRVAKVNRLAGTIAGELVNHIQWVWSAVRPAGEQRVGYTIAGAHTTTTNDRILEATG